MVALFSTSLLHANITYEANAAVVQQQSVCKGTVVDNNGEPVVGASVFVVSNGQKKGSVTDLDGKFEIEVLLLALHLPYLMLVIRPSR